MLAQAGQQGHVQVRPDATGLPVTQTTPAGHAATEAQFLGQVFTRNAGVQSKQDAIEHRLVVHSGAAIFGRGFHRRQQWLQRLPQFVVDLLSRHDTWQRPTAV